MNTNRRSFEINNGPSRDLIFDAMKYSYDEGKVIPVNFLISVAYTAPLDDPGCAYVAAKLDSMTIESIEHEDGSGYSFNIEGHCRAALSAAAAIHSGMTWYKFRAYYNARSRKGRIEFTD